MNIDIALIRNDSDEQVSPISEGFAATRVNSHLARDLSKWFYDTSTGAATGAARCGSFVRGAQIARGVGYPGIRWTRRFTWFGPPERNTLRPRSGDICYLNSAPTVGPPGHTWRPWSCPGPGSRS
jgi:hypothetical protein